MKNVTLNAAQAQDLFGLVKLQPGPNAVPDSVWDKVKSLKLGAMTVEYVQWARAQGFLMFEDSPAQADESGPGASEEPAAQSAPNAAPGPESATAEPAPKKRGRPPKGA